MATDELDSLLNLEQTTRRDSGTSKVRVIFNSESGGRTLIPYKAVSLDEFEREAVALHAEQDRRRVPLAPVDPRAVATVGGVPFDHRAPSKNKEPARSSTQIKFVR